MAGSLLRRFHAAAPPTRSDDYRAAQIRRLELRIERAREGLLSAEEVQFARERARFLAEMPPPSLVPCHRDWQPRNWLVDSDGRLTAIDFENARLAPWHDDLHRLWWDEWAGRPDLRAAFREGYGDSWNDAEIDQMLAASEIRHLFTIVWADQHDDNAYGDFARRSLHQAMSTGT